MAWLGIAWDLHRSHLGNVFLSFGLELNNGMDEGSRHDGLFCLFAR